MDWIEIYTNLFLLHVIYIAPPPKLLLLSLFFFFFPSKKKKKKKIHRNRSIDRSKNEDDAHDLILGQRSNPSNQIMEDTHLDQLPPHLTRLLPLLRFLPVPRRSTAQIQSPRLLRWSHHRTVDPRASPLQTSPISWFWSPPIRDSHTVWGELRHRVPSDVGDHVVQRRRFYYHRFGAFSWVFLV